MKLGEVAWSGPVIHSVQNLGSVCYVLNIELKEPTSK
jgi:hypothetical protein